MTPEQFKSEISKKLSTYDKKGAEDICDAFVRSLYQTIQPIDPGIATSILQLLRNHRLFTCMQKICEALILTDQWNLKIYRQYAQALIDSGLYGAARLMLNEIVRIVEENPGKYPNDIAEQMEAEGLKGRIYKQLYVNIKKQDFFNPNFLTKSLKLYHDVYAKDNSKYQWQGINAVALLNMAAKDGVSVPDYEDGFVIARKILKNITQKDEDREPLSVYDLATAAEACVAMNDMETAKSWIERYLADKNCDAFELTSTLRQMKEVWRLDLNHFIGSRILPLMEAKLLTKEGGEVTATVNDIKRLNLLPAGFERNFGPNVTIDFISYKKGYSRCESVARIGKFSQVGEGSGFLLKGKELWPELGEEWVLLTNAHVISEDPNVRKERNALHPSEAVITFEALDRTQEFGAGKLWFSSPPNALDVSVIRFREQDQAPLLQLTQNITPFDIAPVIPVLNGNAESDPRLYVIGHPKGGTLQFSLQDNLMLDSNETFIHYRTPTEPGSSGSPVFNQKWQLIGIHHAGNEQMPRLNGKEGTYQANEGILIQSIQTAIKEHFTAV
jgi:V8-like Glu-specific endopeptidase